MNWKDNENNKNYNRLIIKNNQLERGLASARNESVSILRKESAPGELKQPNTEKNKKATKKH